MLVETGVGCFVFESLTSALSLPGIGTKPIRPSPGLEPAFCDTGTCGHNNTGGEEAIGLQRTHRLRRQPQHRRG